MCGESVRRISEYPCLRLVIMSPSKMLINPNSLCVFLWEGREEWVIDGERGGKVIFSTWHWARDLILGKYGSWNLDFVVVCLFVFYLFSGYLMWKTSEYAFIQFHPCNIDIILMKSLLHIFIWMYAHPVILITSVENVIFITSPLLLCVMILWIWWFNFHSFHTYL